MNDDPTQEKDSGEEPPEPEPENLEPRDREPEPENLEPLGREPEPALKAIAIILIALTIYGLSGLTKIKIADSPAKKSNDPFMVSNTLGISHAIEKIFVPAKTPVSLCAALRIQGITPEKAIHDENPALNSSSAASRGASRTDKTLLLTIFALDDPAVDSREWISGAAGKPRNFSERDESSAGPTLKKGLEKMVFTRTGHLLKSGADLREPSAANSSFPSEKYAANLGKAVDRFSRECNRVDCVVVTGGAGAGGVYGILRPLIARGGRITMAILALSHAATNSAGITTSANTANQADAATSAGIPTPNGETIEIPVFPSDPASLNLLADGVASITVISKPHELESLVENSIAKLASRVSDRAVIILNAEGRTRIKGVHGCSSVRDGEKIILKIPAISAGEAMDITTELETWRPQAGEFPVVTISGMWIPAGTGKEVPLKSMEIGLKFIEPSEAKPDPAYPVAMLSMDPAESLETVARGPAKATGSGGADSHIRAAFMAGAALEKLMASNLDEAVKLLAGIEDSTTGTPELSGTTRENVSSLARRAFNAMRGSWKP